MTEIVKLICEYLKNPLGIDVTAPRLGWQMKTDRSGARQTAYQVRAASASALLVDGDADLWDSGKVISDQSVHIVYQGKPLHSRQQVYWMVTVWDEMDNVHDSDIAWFELGLLNRKDWQAEWIGASVYGGRQSMLPAPYIRRTFSLPAHFAHARLYITALGLYECTINGQIVGENVLSPGWTDYTRRIRYQVYDVTSLLHEGENVIGAILGDGWAVGYVGWTHRQQYAERPLLFAQLEIQMNDDSLVTVVTDDTWQYRFGPLLSNDLLMGEEYDARREMPGWDQPGYGDSGWHSVQVFSDPSSALVATNRPMIKRIQEIKPSCQPFNNSRFRRRRFIFDMQQNMVGRVRLEGTAPAGTIVTLRFAEVLNPDGSLYTANLRSARATDYYTFKGDGVEVWEPKFTFHGFRYVELIDYPGEVSVDTITGIVIHTDMMATGEFECSDPLINQLHSNIVWGQKGNFVDVPTDCPQRDERLGWTGDIQVFARTSAFNFDVAGFLTKWAQDVADAQDESGSIPIIAPTFDRDSHAYRNDGGPGWSDAAIICPWTVYLCYGDTRILEENYPTMRRFMDFLIRTSPDNIRCAPDYEDWQGFGDWLSVNSTTPRDLIGTAFFAYDACLMAQIAAALGYTDDAERYGKLFDQIKVAFADRFLIGSAAVSADIPAQISKLLDEQDALSRGKLPKVEYGPITSQVFNTNLFTPSQTAYVLALHFDLLPDALIPLAVDELVADIERRDLHLSTGFVGSPYLPFVLSQHGRLDIAYALLNQKSWPSWLYAVTQGATTTWERWDGWTDEHGFQDPNMNSFNHYAYGCIGAWLYNTVAGIDIDVAYAGYKHAVLRPQPGGGLSYASGKLKTLYGELVSEWTLDKRRFEWTVIVPPNTTATLYLPDIFTGAKTVTLNGNPLLDLVRTVESGKYRIIANDIG